MGKKFRIGVFGLGRGMDYGRIFRDCFKDDVVVCAVCDKKEEKRKNALEALPEGTLAFDKFEDFIECGLDGVVLANYFHEHAKYAIDCIKRGIAVFSETTAAVTFKECAELCDAVEKYNGRYYLAENYPFAASCLEMKRIYESGNIGQVGYAEGEYWHPSSAEDVRGLDPDLYHWRKYGNAGAYYLTHAFAPLIYMTGTRPVEVNARAFAPKGRAESILRFSNEYIVPMLVQMDNGAVFRIMGCSMLSPHGNWYRLGCTDGAVETVRGDQSKIRVNYNYWSLPEGEVEQKIYEPTWQTNAEFAEKAGHGGGDFWAAYYFVEFLKGNCEAPFDVYKSVDMAITAIQAWRSVLNHNATYPIPDFRDKRQRDAYRNDNLTIFGDDDGHGATLPCSSTKVSQDYLDKYTEIMDKQFNK